MRGGVGGEVGDDQVDKKRVYWVRARVELYARGDLGVAEERAEGWEVVGAVRRRVLLFIYHCSGINNR